MNTNKLKTRNYTLFSSVFNVYYIFLSFSDIFFHIDSYILKKSVYLRLYLL